MSKNILEQLQIALSPHPYLVFKRETGEEVLLLLSSIVSATKSPGVLILTLSNGVTLELYAADWLEFSKRLQEGIDFAVERSSQAAMQALLSGAKIPLT